MAKPKFTLTSDLINIGPEENQPQTAPNAPIEMPSKKVIKYERLSLNIRKDLKKDFQLWCIQKGFNMTQALEVAIKRIMDNH